MRNVLIDGIKPKSVTAPKNTTEFCRLLVEAEKQSQVVVPAGGGTKLDWGNRPTHIDHLVWMDHFNRILDYEPADLTVTVEAGCKLITLQNELAKHGQYLPFDPPFYDECSVGGVVACNSSGPLRYRYGAIRDYVIGMRMAHADGQISKAGGRVVKNVSGYDLCKLYAGSCGTLGVITEVNFKVLPRPVAEGACAITFDSMSDALEGIQKIIQSPLLPDALELMDAGAVARLNQKICADWLSPRLTLLVRWSELEEAIAWQSKELVDRVLPSTKGEATILDAELFKVLWPHVVRFREELAEPCKQLWVCRTVVPMAYIGEIFERARELEKQMRGVMYVTCHAGNGIVYWYLTGGDVLLERAEVFLRAIEQLRKFSTGFGGYTIIESAPPAIKQRIDIWGSAAISEGSQRLMRALKDNFDPKHIFNRGRFVGSI